MTAACDRPADTFADRYRHHHDLPGDSPANRLGLDYRAEAGRFAYTGPIIDVHTHIGTADAAEVYRQATEAYGIVKTWSMTNLEQCDEVQAVLGDAVEFIAVPDYANRDKPGCFTTDWMKRIERFRGRGCRMVKFWAAPRGRDMGDDALLIDSPARLEQMRLAHGLGYRRFMTHIADPDTWFATKYADAAHYGTKRDQYAGLERVLDGFGDVTWIAAHMAGSPEDLDFLRGLLDRHDNLVLDCSATKWMVRELSRHPDRFRGFVEANPARVLFGTDIVANSDNVRPPSPEDVARLEEERKAGRPGLGAGHGFDLYASRFWALRTLLETGYDGPSPIADPDLPMIDPSIPEGSTPPLRGASLPKDLLPALYHDNAARVLANAP